MNARLQHILTIYLKPQVLAIGFLGFSCGLPLALTASTMLTWLAEVGIDVKTIGYFASVATPYSIKFLWSPVIDTTRLPLLCRWLGRRRGWLLFTQLLLMAAIAMMGFIDPRDGAVLFSLVAVLVAFFSASQDIVVDAYRIERVEKEFQGAASAMYSLGYRFAMLLTGAGALWLAQYLQEIKGMDFTTSWQWTYILMAAVVLIGIVTTLLVKEPEVPEGSEAAPVSLEASRAQRAAAWFRRSVIDPFADFMQRPGWLHILIFVLLYRLADAYLGVMFNPFLLDIGFTKAQIAEIVKFYGMIATMVGGFIGGALVFRFGMLKTLFACGVLHMFTNLLLVGLAAMVSYPDYLALAAEQQLQWRKWALMLCIVTENSTAGMASVAFIAYLSSLCKVNYTATQYALLSSLAAVARTLISTTSGETAFWMKSNGFGWEGFFAFASLLAIPALLLLYYIHRRFDPENTKSS